MARIGMERKLMEVRERRAMRYTELEQYELTDSKKK
jgi:hypothetical protein